MASNHDMNRKLHKLASGNTVTVRIGQDTRSVNKALHAAGTGRAGLRNQLPPKPSGMSMSDALRTMAQEAVEDANRPRETWHWPPDDGEV